ncbi:MAG: nuclear transport factor 2 family protein [Candidatus Omnitrophota bacterium]|nr:MAG: nuclear transport factor 2 family protein [Candidatus Omnitrophota bacterium]
MKKIIILALLVILSFFSSFVFAQEWSKQQMQVWKVIEQRWDNLINKKNLKGFVKDFHPEFRGFVNWRALPINKTILEQGGNSVIETVNFSFYVIEPVSIIIEDDTAVVHYFCNTRGNTNSGKPFDSEFRYTDFLIKQKGKWVTIGAHKEKL